LFHKDRSQRSFAPSFVRSFAAKFGRPFVRSRQSSFAPSFVRSLLRPFARSFVRSKVRSLVRSIVRAFVRVRSFVRSFANILRQGSFALSQRSFAHSQRSSARSLIPPVGHKLTRASHCRGITAVASRPWPLHDGAAHCRSPASGGRCRVFSASSLPSHPSFSSFLRSSIVAWALTRVVGLCMTLLPTAAPARLGGAAALGLVAQWRREDGSAALMPQNTCARSL